MPDEIKSDKTIPGDQGVVSLEENAVHLWLAHCFDARHDEGLLAEYRDLLNPEEMLRLQRFRLADDRRRYLIARALVRHTLSRYAPVSPEAWRFERGEHDKPEIAGSAWPLRFNLSHSGEWAVCAVGLCHDVGVDIECTRRVNDVLAIARHYFSASEQHALRALDETSARDRFFDLWTLKESFMKARGEGIALGLSNFSFDFTASDRPTHKIGVHFADVLRDDPLAWRFWLSAPVSDYRLALAWHQGQGCGDTAIRLYRVVPGAQCQCNAIFSEGIDVVTLTRMRVVAPVTVGQGAYVLRLVFADCVIWVAPILGS